MTSESSPLDLFAVTAPGLEPLAAAELEAMGLPGAVEAGGVSFRADDAGLYAASLRLRTASRVLVRAAAFRARTFYELERHAGRVPWERWVAQGGAVRLRVSAKKSRLYHEGAIAERLMSAVAKRVSGATAAGGAGGTGDEDEPDEGADAQLFVVRVSRDGFTVSADASGALLHRRGYRQAVAKAPLRETLAAAMLLGSGWDARAPLVDPMCGSGTLPIEAALLARRIAPGLASPGHAPRGYAFAAWPGFDRAAWEAEVARATEEILPAAGVPILGSDRDEGAVEAARANAARAGVADDVDFSVRPLSAVDPPEGPGWLVANPPYGVRVGETKALRDLYAAVGRLARGRLAGWTVALLSAEPRLEAQVGIAFREALRTRNGGIAVRLVVGQG